MSYVDMCLIKNIFNEYGMCTNCFEKVWENLYPAFINLDYEDEWSEIEDIIQLKDGNIAFAGIKVGTNAEFLVIYSLDLQEVIQKISIYNYNKFTELKNGNLFGIDYGLEGEIYSRNRVLRCEDSSLVYKYCVNRFLARNGIRYNWFATIRTAIELENGLLCVVVSTNPRNNQKQKKSWIEIWDPNINYKKGIEESEKTIYESITGLSFNCIIQLDKDYLALGSNTGAISIFSLKTREIEYQHTYPHTTEIYQLIKLSEDRFLSNSKDGTIGVHLFENVNNNVSVRCLSKFKNPADCAEDTLVVLSDNRWYTFYKDLKVRSLIDGNIVGEITIQTDGSLIENIVELKDSRILIQYEGTAQIEFGKLFKKS